MALNLTVEDVIRLTAPGGVSVPNWRVIIEEAKASDRVWMDPWADGSIGWRGFLPEAPTVPTVKPVRSSRLGFMAAIARLPATGPKSGQYSVLSEMSSYAAEDGSKVYPSNNTVANALKVSRDTVSRQIKASVEGGWLIRDGMKGRTVLYALAVPEAA